jgi:nucleoside-diphosphate-sugar epimerase
VRLLVTGATGFLGGRATELLRAGGHEVVALTRPGHADRAASRALDAVELDAGDPAARALVAGCTAVLHFAGMPDPARSRADPATAVRLNAGLTVNLLDGCLEHGAALVYPSTIRAEAPPDAYGLSKRLGEEACRLHAARATSVRIASVFGPGQVAWEGATGAIAAFAARALDGRTITIPGNPRRTRDFLYVDDFVAGLERLAADPDPPPLVYAGSGTPTALEDAARLAVQAAGGDPVAVELTGGTLPAGEDDSYALPSGVARLPASARPLRQAVSAYVDWLRDHPAAQGRPGR